MGESPGVFRGSDFGINIYGIYGGFLSEFVHPLGNIKGYFTNGTYEHLDILAASMGIVIAFITGELTSKDGGKEHDEYVYT